MTGLLVAGVDEAGRGPLAGPVAAAARKATTSSPGRPVTQFAVARPSVRSSRPRTATCWPGAGARSRSAAALAALPASACAVSSAAYRRSTSPAGPKATVRPPWR
jgi:hypothetical protein